MFGWGRDKAASKAQTMPTVPFDPDKVTKAVSTDLLKNIKELPDINARDVRSIYDAALRSISAGRALHVIYEALLPIDGMSPARANEIARLLNNKATALMNSESQSRLGITHARWLYSGASCGDPDQDAAHSAANGQTYPIGKGMFLNGLWTWPGRENGCKCVSRSVIPGL